MVAPADNFQFVLADTGLLVGDGALGEVRGSWPQGFLATPPYRARDVERPAGGPGSALGATDPAERELVIPLRFKSSERTDDERMADVRQSVQPILDGWAPARDVLEWRLDSQLPGTPETVMSYFGEPREVNEPEYLETLGALSLDLHFVCSDPYAYGAEDTATSDDGTVELDQAGSVNSRRCVIVATIDGPTGTITNLDDPDGLTMNFVELSGDTVTINLAGWNVTDDDDNNADGTLRNDSGWPELVPGANRLAFTGFDQLDVAWRPAYR